MRVPVNITFEFLHRILQAAFGWHDSHLYCFGMLKDWDIAKYNKPEIELISQKEDFEYKPDAIFTDSVKLIDYIGTYQKIIYIYDYGDGWLHQIEVENYNSDCYEELPILLSGTGDSPPEDVGGAGGFAEFPAASQILHSFLTRDLIGLNCSGVTLCGSLTPTGSSMPSSGGISSSSNLPSVSHNSL